jgi:lipopolysaccharide transport system permease protein
LRSPRRFIYAALADLRVSPPVAWSLFLRSLQAQYRQSWLGYVWLLLPPLATALTWIYLNRANILDVGQTAVPYPVYVLTGTLLWQTFAEALNCPIRQLTASRDILTKTRIPHEALLLAGIIEVLFNFVVRFGVMLPALIWFEMPLSLSMILAAFGVLSLLLVGLSVGLLLTPLGLLYQDVSRSLSIFVGFWFFLTPVIYPPPSVGGAALVVMLNPVTPLLITTRDWLTLGASVRSPAPGFMVVTGLSLLCFVVGWLCYRLAKPHLTARL